LPFGSSPGAPCWVSAQRAHAADAVLPLAVYEDERRGRRGWQNNWGRVSRSRKLAVRFALGGADVALIGFGAPEQVDEGGRPGRARAAAGGGAQRYDGRAATSPVKESPVSSELPLPAPCSAPCAFRQREALGISNRWQGGQYVHHPHPCRTGRLWASTTCPQLPTSTRPSPFVRESPLQPLDRAGGPARRSHRRCHTAGEGAGHRGRHDGQAGGRTAAGRPARSR